MADNQACIIMKNIYIVKHIIYSFKDKKVKTNFSSWSQK